ncbi:MAG: hypothetical protein GY847_24000 [Proteobacteria bacterium]|nr:hypothetical protein [Pseudomonadota bacterium]
MKKRKSYLQMACLLGICTFVLISAVLAAQVKKANVKKQPKAIVGRIDLNRVTVTRASKASPARTEPGSKSRAKEPGPLSRQERAAAVEQVRVASAPSKSSSKKKVEPPPPPPPKFTLGAKQSRVGVSWLEVSNGFSFPGGSTAVRAPHSTIIVSNKHSFVVLHFNPLSRNKAYMLDCTVSTREKSGQITPFHTMENDPNAAWKLEGAINGEISPQSGHLIAGFVAARAQDDIKIRPPSNVQLGYVYKCELTRVD